MTPQQLLETAQRVWVVFAVVIAVYVVILMILFTPDDHD